MTAGDCYELGKTLHHLKDYKNALAWMTEALRKYREADDENDMYSFREVDTLEFIAHAHYLLGKCIM